MPMLQTQLGTIALSLLLLLEGLITAAALWLLYYALKCAIRDGINESILGRARPTPRVSAADTMPGPDMRAER